MKSGDLENHRSGYFRLGGDCKRTGLCCNLSTLSRILNVKSRLDYVILKLLYLARKTLVTLSFSEFCGLIFRSADTGGRQL
jgi:hypothetical protein